ncbi:MAG: hypothetical protein V4521_00685, partial [Pseudomonadota bacterium]
ILGTGLGHTHGVRRRGISNIFGRNVTGQVSPAMRAQYQIRETFISALARPVNASEIVITPPPPA